MDAVSAVERVAALELLAATYVDKRRDTNLAVSCWLRALRLRSTISHSPSSLQTAATTCSSSSSSRSFLTSSATKCRGVGADANRSEQVAPDIFYTEVLPGKLYDIFNEALSSHHPLHEDPEEPEIFSDDEMEEEDEHEHEHEEEEDELDGLPLPPPIAELHAHEEEGDESLEPPIGIDVNQLHPEQQVPLQHELNDAHEASNELNHSDHVTPAAQAQLLSPAASAESSSSGSGDAPASAHGNDNNNISISINNDTSYSSSGKQQPEPEFLPARTEADIAALASNLDAARLHALATRERILGPLHPECNYYLRYRGAAYADSNRFGLCLDLWSYALDRLREHWRSSILEPVTPVIRYVQQYYDARYNNRKRTHSSQFPQAKENCSPDDSEFEEAVSAVDMATQEETEREAYFSNMQSTYLSFQELFGYFVSSEHVVPVDIDVNAMFRVLDCLVSDLELIHECESARNANAQMLHGALSKPTRRYRELKFPQRSPDRDTAVSRHQILALNVAAVLLSQRALFSRVGGAATVPPSNTLPLSLSGLSVEDSNPNPSDDLQALENGDGDSEPRAYLTPLQLASLLAPAGQPTDPNSHWHAFLLLMKRLARIPLRYQYLTQIIIAL